MSSTSSTLTFFGNLGLFLPPKVETIWVVACYSQAREETRPSFVPQFLQNSASAGLAVLQLSQILGPCMGPARGVASVHGRTGFSIVLASSVRCASTEP